MTLELRAAFSPNPRVEPLIDGSVEVPGVSFRWSRGTAGELHERHLRVGDHDVFEFSISNFLVTLERHRPLWDWVMLPVYASKATLGLNTLVNAAAGVDTERDLRGHRFGIPDFTMTAGLWFRAQLRVLHGIETRAIDWVVTRSPEQSHGRQLGFDTAPPRGIELEWASPGAAESMLQSGRLGAAFPSADVPIDASSDSVRRLFDDGGRQFMAEFAARTGFLPVNHVVLMRRDVAERHPWLPEALIEGFERAKTVAYRRDPSARGILRSGNTDVDWQTATFGADPYPYGLSANAAMLRLAAEQSHLDGLTDIVQDLLASVPASVRGS